MGTIMLLIGAGLIFSLIVFFICEEKSLADVSFSDMKCLVKDDVTINECFSEYRTIRYASVYFLAVFAFAFIVGIYAFLPNAFGLREIFAYVFITSLFGSTLILFVKWQKQPMIKLVSSFIYGSLFMAASALGLTLVYLFNG